MSKTISTLLYSVIISGVILLAMPTSGMGKSGWLEYHNHGLVLSYPSEWKRMGPGSTHKIQTMLNQQFLEMGNAQVSVVGLDVLLNLPAFRVMITKERFETVPSPDYLIKERGKFLTEAQVRGRVKSYGEMKPLTINGHSAIEFQDVDKGVQGYSSSIRLLCGRDTWHISFTGNTQATYQQYRPKIEQMKHSMSLTDECKGDG